MTSFVHVDQPSQHVAVVRFERAVQGVANVAKSMSGARGGATMLLAAIVSALLVVANQVVENWTEGHLLAAWIAMWVIGFAALALFAAPARAAVVSLGKGYQGWAAARRAQANDEKMWQVAVTDARVMADISRNMNLSIRAQRMLRAYY